MTPKPGLYFLSARNLDIEGTPREATHTISRHAEVRQRRTAESRSNREIPVAFLASSDILPFDRKAHPQAGLLRDGPLEFIATRPLHVIGDDQ